VERGGYNEVGFFSFSFFKKKSVEIGIEIEMEIWIGEIGRYDS